MPFLDRLERPDRERLMAASRSLTFARGAYLLRRGEPGGDLYLVEAGELEIVDTRARPEIVIDSVGPGGLVGEMAFLDESPRAADVRAAAETRCMRWERGVLLAVLDNDPALSASFYRALAEGLVDRMRNLTANAVAGGLGTVRAAPSSTTVMLARDSHDAAERARVRWLDAEARLRREPGTPEAAVLVRETAAALVREMQTLARQFQESGKGVEAGQALARELHAFLVRARTVVLAWDATGRAGARSALVSHLVRAVPSGEGALGQALDAALLGLPTPAALVWRADVAAAVTAASTEAAVRRGAGRPDGAGTGRPVRVLMVNGVASGLPERYGSSLQGFRGGGILLTTVEESREALASVGSGPGGLPLSVELRRVQDDLAAFVLGRSRVHHEPQDVVVLDSLAEYLPERLLAEVLTSARDRLTPGGMVLVTALCPSPDAPLWESVLGWSQLRRTPQALARLVVDVGLADVRVQTDGAGVIVSGIRR